MVHRNIRFSLEEAETGIWRWKYLIGEQVKSGDLRLPSRKAAIRKIHQMIDRDLRIRHIAERKRGTASSSR
jgi:hypothetical protein